MKEPLSQATTTPPPTMRAAPEIQGRNLCRWTTSCHALKLGGRFSFLFLGGLGTALYLHSWGEEQWQAYQVRKQVLTPEVEGRLLQEFPESTPGQRQKIALAEHETRRARAEVAGELRYQEVLSQPLFGDSPPSASSIDFKES